ncbi:MAG: DUF5714 domain-containing protein [Oscillospiraceae bacterium]
MKFNMTLTEQAIRNYCAATSQTSPADIALALMREPVIRIHGPEHHYLTAAALCAAWCNVKGLQKDERLGALRERCARIFPGVCGYYGVCGAVLAAGAFFSDALGTTYLSEREWQLTNEFTARLQKAVAASCSRGPRCCKRTTLAVLLAAGDALWELTGVRLGVTEYTSCEFCADNTQCIGSACVFGA